MSLDNRTALFRMPIELRWRDLDAFNHVNNSNFMTYLEEARIRWFDSLGEDWVTDATAPAQLSTISPRWRQRRQAVTVSGEASARFSGRQRGAVGPTDNIKESPKAT